MVHQRAHYSLFQPSHGCENKKNKKKRAGVLQRMEFVRVGDCVRHFSEMFDQCQNDRLMENVTLFISTTK